MDEAAVDENGKEITNIIKEVGEEAKVVIPGVTDDKDTKVTWRSTNPKIASVDENGKISMLAPGMTQIIVTAVKGDEKKTDTIVVLVDADYEFIVKAYKSKDEDFDYDFVKAEKEGFLALKKALKEAGIPFVTYKNYKENKHEYNKFLGNLNNLLHEMEVKQWTK
jgi:hypothetical protein